MRRTSFAAFQCSLARTLEVVGDWWSPLILRDLFVGLDRFDQLVEDLGISRNLLTDRLDALVAGGVVRRVPYQRHPPRHRYTLTEAGRELVPVLLAMTTWGDKWATPDGGPPLRIRHTTCGHVTTPEVTCSECGIPLRAESSQPLPGPGGRPAPGTALLPTVLPASPDGTARGQ